MNEVQFAHNNHYGCKSCKFATFLVYCTNNFISVSSKILRDGASTHGRIHGSMYMYM